MASSNEAWIARLLNQPITLDDSAAPNKLPSTGMSTLWLTPAKSASTHPTWETGSGRPHTHTHTHTHIPQCSTIIAMTALQALNVRPPPPDLNAPEVNTTPIICCQLYIFLKTLPKFHNFVTSIVSRTLLHYCFSCILLFLPHIYVWDMETCVCFGWILPPMTGCEGWVSGRGRRTTRWSYSCLRTTVLQYYSRAGRHRSTWAHTPVTLVPAFTLPQWGWRLLTHPGWWVEGEVYTHPGWSMDGYRQAGQSWLV